MAFAIKVERVVGSSSGCCQPMLMVKLPCGSASTNRTFLPLSLIHIFSTTKLSARTLLRGMQFLLRQYDKHASQGKQSMKRLVRQNHGVTNVEIQKTGIKDFDRYAKPVSYTHLDVYKRQAQTRALLEKGIDPINVPGLRISVTSDDSRMINTDRTPKVILSRCV